MEKYNKNPRIWTETDRSKLKSNLEELGDISGIVHDVNSDEIPCGNFRSEIIDINSCQIEVIKEFDKPDHQGTIAIGYVIWNNQRLNYRKVNWTKEQCEKACITANSLGGDFDYEKLLSDDWDKLLLSDWGVDLSEYLNEGNEEESAYTRKIESPVYIPSGDVPAVRDLYDQTKTLELSEKIKDSDIPEDIKDFLLKAAERHTIFNYERIANFYAHADDRVKNLMEDSALIIIDFNKAIDLGYVKLSEEIKDQYTEEYGE